MTTQTAPATTTEESLNLACALVERAEKECLTRDVSALILEANAALQGHAMAITGTDHIDVTSINADVSMMVARGFQAQTANFIDLALCKIIDAGRSDIAATLYQALKALGNARDANEICTGVMLPCSTEPDQRDLKEAVAFAQNDLFAQEAAEAAQFVPAEIIDDATADGSDEEFISITSDRLWVRLCETAAPEAPEPVEDEDELDCSPEIVEVRSVPACASESSGTFFGLVVPPPPPVPSMYRMSAPPALPNRQYHNPNQLKLPFWVTDAGEEHEVFMSFRRPGQSDYADLQAVMSN